MRLFRRSPERIDVDAILAEKQRYLKAVRRGGYGKKAQQEQKRADAINRQRRGRAE